MEYLYLGLSLSSSLVIALLLRVFEHKGLNRVVVIASNYIVAGSLSYFLSRKTALTWPVLCYGIVLGLFFFLAFWVFSRGIKAKGLASAVTIGRLSLAVPVLLSIVLWGEKPLLLDIVALLLIFSIIFCWEGKIGKLSPILMLIFLLFGLLDSAIKYFKLGFPRVDDGFFLIIVFYSGMVWSWGYIVFSGQKPRGKEVVSGLLIGVPNFFSSFFMLKALVSVPAYIAFPFLNIGMIILSAMIGTIFFKERLGHKKIVLLLLGVFAVWMLTS